MEKGVRKGFNDAYIACEGNLTLMQNVLAQAMKQRNETGKALFIVISSAVIDVMNDDDERKRLFHELYNFL